MGVRHREGAGGECNNRWIRFQKILGGGCCDVCSAALVGLDCPLFVAFFMLGG